ALCYAWSADGTPARADLEESLTLVATFIGFAAVAALLRFAPERRPPERVSVEVVAAVAAVLAVPADCHPTGWVPLDALLRAGFAALLVLSAARRGPLVVAWTAGVISLVLAAAATVAFGGMVALVSVGAREPLIQALAAGATAQVALRLHWRLALGASAVAVMVATLPLLAAGLATLGARGRRIVGWSVAGVAVFSV